MNAALPPTQSHLSLAPPGFLESHPELHHYTSFCGLKGVVESRSLWATHYRHLNDSSEVTLLEAPLIKAAIPRFEKILAERPALRPLIENFGGVEKVARELTCPSSEFLGQAVA
jgi:hypothetical protein